MFIRFIKDSFGLSVYNTSAVGPKGANAVLVPYAEL